jgi:hypothetical protein
LGVIFVRPRVAEVDQQAIAEILCNITLEAGDHLGAGLLIGPYHLAPLLRVQLAGERGRVHEVAEQHGELAAFRLGCACNVGGRCGPRLVASGRSLPGRRVGGERCAWGARLSRPDQHAAVFIHGQPLAVDELFLEIR